MALLPSSHGLPPSRLIDTLVGGASGWSCSRSRLDRAGAEAGALAGQVHSIALDLLVAAGIPADQAARSVRRAATAPVS